MPRAFQIIPMQGSGQAAAQSASNTLASAGRIRREEEKIRQGDQKFQLLAMEAAQEAQTRLREQQAAAFGARQMADALQVDVGQAMQRHQATRSNPSLPSPLQGVFAGYAQTARLMAERDPEAAQRFITEVARPALERYQAQVKRGQVMSMIDFMESKGMFETSAEGDTPGAQLWRQRADMDPDGTLPLLDARRDAWTDRRRKELDAQHFTSQYESLLAPNALPPGSPIRAQLNALTAAVEAGMEIPDAARQLRMILPDQEEGFEEVEKGGINFLPPGQRAHVPRRMSFMDRIFGDGSNSVYSPEEQEMIYGRKLGGGRDYIGQGPFKPEAGASADVRAYDTLSAEEKAPVAQRLREAVQAKGGQPLTASEVRQIGAELGVNLEALIGAGS